MASLILRTHNCTQHITNSFLGHRTEEITRAGRQQHVTTHTFRESTAKSHGYAQLQVQTDSTHLESNRGRV
jgi:hypothetical protein